MAVRFEDEMAIHQAKENLLAPGNIQGWLILAYTGPTTVTLQATGTGSVDELRNFLLEDDIQYILTRLPELDKDVADRKDGKCVTKDVFITWIGPKLRTIERGKKQSHIGTVATFLQPHQVELTAKNLEKFSEETVRQKSEPSSGSHLIE